MAPSLPSEAGRGGGEDRAPSLPSEAGRGGGED